MTRTGTLVARTLGYCAVLSALGLLASRAEAQSSASRSPSASGGGWVVSGESNTPSDESNDTVWQPSRADRESVNSNGTTPTHWITPTRKPSAASAQKSRPDQGVRPTSTTKQQSGASRTAAREPNPFTPPVEAEQLSANKPQPPRPTATNQKPVKITVQTREAAATDTPAAIKTSAKEGDASKAPRKVVIASGPPASQSAAQPGPGRKHPNIASPSGEARNNAHAATGRSGPRNSGQNRLFDDGSWVRPLKQAAFQANQQEEELFAPGNGPGMHSMNGLEDMPGMPVPGSRSPGHGGEWIDGGSGGPCCDGQCELGGCDDGCCDPCETGCCESCGRSQQDDLWCVGFGDDESCHTIRVRVPRFHEVVIFGGVHGFKGPYDRDRDSGNFGFQEGFNVGAKLPFSDVGYQFGYQATQNQLSGDTNTGDTNGFSQHFITAGVFRRVPDGIQGGAVFDLLKDERGDWIEFTQARGELSFVDRGCHEFGADVAIHLKDHTFVEINDNDTTTITRFQATDQYLLFYRMHGNRGGEGRVFGGITDDSDAIVGSDFLLPMKDSWSLQSEFTYLIPDNGGGAVGAKQEAWNIAINLVWHWHGHARSCHSSPYRPLFNVADNGSLIVDDRP